MEKSHFSSPVPKVSYCDPMISRLHLSLSINNLLTRWIFTKLHWYDPWVVLFQSCSKKSISCRILVAMAISLVKNYWSDFKIIWYKWPLGDPLPNLFILFGVEPTNAALAHSTAMSGALNHYTTEASPPSTAMSDALNHYTNEASTLQC